MKHSTGYIWPVIAGLLLAAVIALALPEHFHVQHTPSASTSGNGAEGSSLIGPVSYAAGVQRASPSVVNILTRKQPSAQPTSLNDQLARQYGGISRTQNSSEVEGSLGAGVVISPEGYILTNNHVVSQAEEILVTLQDGRWASATLIGVDPETDLAVIKTELSDLPVIPIGDSQNVRVGDVVLAIGNPFGRGQTVTQGIVSASGRDVMELSSFVNFIQTDAAINQGNSGGALVDVYGNLIGINTAVAENAGSIGYAIPADIALKIVSALIEHQEVVRGWIGVNAYLLNPEVAQQLGISPPRAMIIGDVYMNGPAYLAGLRSGDILMEVDGNPIVDGLQVLQKISDTPPGATMLFGVLRDGQITHLNITTARRPDAALR